MTRTELRQFVRDMTLVEPHEASDFLIDQFLNEGYYKVMRRRDWSWRRKRFTAPIEIDGHTIDLDRQFPGITAIADLRVGRSGIGEPAWNQITLSEATFYGDEDRIWWHGIERSYYFDPHQYTIILSEKMNHHPDRDSVVVSVFYEPPWEAEATASPPLVPEHAHMSTIANFAVHRLWERQEDLDRSDAYLGRFEVALDELVYQENTRNSDRPKIFGELPHRGRGWGNMPWLSDAGRDVAPVGMHLHVVSHVQPIDPADGTVWTDPGP